MASIEEIPVSMNSLGTSRLIGLIASPSFAVDTQTLACSYSRPTIDGSANTIIYPSQHARTNVQQDGFG
jgi:hypothetical protein